MDVTLYGMTAIDMALMLLVLWIAKGMALLPEPQFGWPEFFLAVALAQPDILLKQSAGVPQGLQGRRWL